MMSCSNLTRVPSHYFLHFGRVTETFDTLRGSTSCLLFSRSSCLKSTSSTSSISSLLAKPDIMQEGQNDCAHPAEEKDADVSSTSTSTCKSVSDSDDDDDISESETSLEEAVLPETDRINSLLEIDRINLACPRQYGYTKIYEVEEGLNGNAGTKMAIPKVSLYLERGKALEHLNMIEYECLMQMEKKKTEKDNGATKKPGRQSCRNRSGSVTALPSATRSNKRRTDRSVRRKPAKVAAARSKFTS
jgi:hypothetical protein